MDHLYIIEKGGVQEQNPMEHLLELPQILDMVLNTLSQKHPPHLCTTIIKYNI